MTATVIVSKSALFEMVMAAFEAYAIKHDGKKIVSLETHAQLWGKTNKTHPFKCSIEHFSVDSSSKQERGCVTPEPLSLEIKKDIAQAFGEGYSHLGTFHTHPWLRGEVCGKDSAGKKIKVESTNDIRKYDLFNFSNGDHNCEVDEPTIWVGEKKYSVALVMTIHAAKKADNTKDGGIDDNPVEFSLGNVKLWLKAQVYEHKITGTLTDADRKSLNIYRLKEYEDFKADAPTMPIPIDTDLECDADFLFEKFGRLKISSRKATYENSKTADKRWFVY
jgi:hypothetical protein